MAINPINTNVGAQVGVQNLNRINRGLDTTQNRISTGFKVNSAVDNAASFAIAAGISSDIGALAAVSQGIGNAQGVATIANAATTAISDQLGDLPATIVAAQNPGNTSQQQAILQQDFQAQVGQLNQVISSASFNGTNLISSGSANANVIANTDGTTISIRGNGSVGDAVAALATQNVTTIAGAQTALGTLNAANASVSTALGNIGADTRALGARDDFLDKLSTAQQIGLGSIRDADLAREAARNSAQRVQQQLAVSTLNIANARPASVAPLFR
ncbi:MAG: flagellin [Alphaproteobacteria bacterium]|nr:flagellin [Alphaproteobacteria bacterium]